MAHNSNISAENFVLEMSSGFFCKMSKFSVKKATTSHLPCKAKLLALQDPVWNLLCSLSRPEPYMVYGNQWSIQAQRTSGLQYFFVLFVHVCAPGSACIGSISVCACTCMSVLIYSKYKLFSERPLFILKRKSVILHRSLAQNLSLTQSAILD